MQMYIGSGARFEKPPCGRAKRRVFAEHREGSMLLSDRLSGQSQAKRKDVRIELISPDLEEPSFSEQVDAKPNYQGLTVKIFVETEIQILKIRQLRSQLQS